MAVNVSAVQLLRSDLPHTVGLHVVAEGVETAEQLGFLREHGCDSVQGYWMARPMAAAACLEFVRNWAQPAGAPTSPSPVALP